MALPTQDDHSSSHEAMNSNPADPNMHMAGTPVYAQQAPYVLFQAKGKVSSIRIVVEHLAIRKRIQASIQKRMSSCPSFR